METNLEQQARAFELGGRDTYIHFPRWCDDLERRMLTDWVEETAGDGVAWLEVREAAVRGWQERHDSLAHAVEVDDGDSDEPVERESLLLHAKLFGAADRYQRFPVWSDDLEYKLRADWRSRYGGVSWLDVREAVKAGWEDRRESASRVAAVEQ
jgi:hypothetical protein